MFSLKKIKLGFIYLFLLLSKVHQICFVYINISLFPRKCRNKIPKKFQRKCQLIPLGFQVLRCPITPFPLPPLSTALPPLFQTSIPIFSELTSCLVSTARTSPPPLALRRNSIASLPSQNSGRLSVTPRGRRRPRHALTL